MKILKYSAITLLVVIVLLAIAPFLFKGKIISAIKNAANENLEATLDFDDVSLSLLRSFPNLSVGITKLSIVSTKEPFAGDTLVYVNNFRVVTNLSPIWTGKPYEILRMQIDDPVIKAIVSNQGIANWDIVKPTADTTEAEQDTTGAAPFNLSIKKLQLNNGRLLYDDSTLQMRFAAAGIQLDMSGDMSLTVYDLLTRLIIEKTDLWYAGAHYINKVKTDVDAVLAVDMDSMKFGFKNTQMTMNDLRMKFEGFFAMPADTVYDMDIRFAAPDADFKSVLSLIPAFYMQDYQGLKATGTLNLNGFVRGRYDFSEKLPAFAINTEIKDGAFQYPAMPAAVSAVNLNLEVNNPGGNADLTVVRLEPFGLQVDGQAFSGFFRMRTPISNPFMDMGLKGKIDFSKLAGSMPMPEGSSLAGIMNADMQAKGYLKTLELGRYQDFSASGFAEFINIVYKTSDAPETRVNTGRIDFNNQKVSVSNLDLLLGENDLAMNGSVEDFFPYMLADGTLKGNLDVKSNYFNANAFLTEDDSSSANTATSDTAALEAIEIPANLNLKMTMAAQKIIYSNYTIENAAAAMRVQNSALYIDNLESNLLGGRLSMSGNYRSKPDKRPYTSFDMKLANISAKELFAHTTTIQKMAPFFNFIGGNINLNLGFDDLQLDPHMQPDLNTLNASGLFQVLEGSLSGMPSQEKLASTLKMEGLKNLTLKQVLANFDIVNGMMMVREFPINTGSDVKMSFGGIQKLSTEMEYALRMQVPRAMIGMTDAAISGLTSAAGSVIPGFKAPETLNVDVLIEGTPQNPVFKPRLAGFGNDLKDQAKQALQDEIDKQKQEAERRLAEEKRKLEEEVERQKKDLENKAQEEKERLLRELEEKKRQEEQRLKEEAEKQKKKLLKDLMNK